MVTVNLLYTHNIYISVGKYLEQYGTSFEVRAKKAVNHLIFSPPFWHDCVGFKQL